MPPHSLYDSFIIPVTSRTTKWATAWRPIIPQPTIVIERPTLIDRPLMPKTTLKSSDSTVSENIDKAPSFMFEIKD